MEKTNVMRLMDAAKIPYTPHFYDPALTDGQRVAAALSRTGDETFKTLVTVGADGSPLVFIVPVNAVLSLKKAARASGQKSVSMLPQKELLPLTGYVHGGCSPIGMKKPFPSFIDETAVLFPTVCVSAGRRGAQIELPPEALSAYIGAAFFDLTE